jgi:26S proteasome regulatory subunit N8
MVIYLFLLTIHHEPQISSLIKRFCGKEPVFVVIDVRPGIVGLPTTAYEATDELELDGKEIHRVFKHIPCSIEAEEAEEVTTTTFFPLLLSYLIIFPLIFPLPSQVGVEHLLRDINDPSTSTLALQIQQKVNGLTGLLGRLTEIKAYLEKVVNGTIPINNQITYNLQNIFNLLPNLNVEELVRSMLVKTNDMHLVIYLSSLIRSVLALHGLLTNKIKYKDLDNVLDKTAGLEETEKKEKEKAEKTASAEKTEVSKD